MVRGMEQGIKPRVTGDGTYAGRGIAPRRVRGQHLWWPVAESLVWPDLVRVSGLSGARANLVLIDS